MNRQVSSITIQKLLIVGLVAATIYACGPNDIYAPLYYNDVVSPTKPDVHKTPNEIPSQWQQFIANQSDVISDASTDAGNTGIVTDVRQDTIPDVENDLNQDVQQSDEQQQECEGSNCQEEGIDSDKDYDGVPDKVDKCVETDGWIDIGSGLVVGKVVDIQTGCAAVKLKRHCSGDVAPPRVLLGKVEPFFYAYRIGLRVRKVKVNGKTWLEFDLGGDPDYVYNDIDVVEDCPDLSGTLGLIIKLGDKTRVWGCKLYERPSYEPIEDESGQVFKVATHEFATGLTLNGGVIPNLCKISATALGVSGDELELLWNSGKVTISAVAAIKDGAGNVRKIYIGTGSSKEGACTISIERDPDTKVEYENCPDTSIEPAPNVDITNLHFQTFDATESFLFVNWAEIQGKVEVTGAASNDCSVGVVLTRLNATSIKESSPVLCPTVKLDSGEYQFSCVISHHILASDFPYVANLLVTVDCGGNEFVKEYEMQVQN